MKIFIEKLIEKFEKEAFAVQLDKGIRHPSTLDAMMEKFTVFRIKEIVNHVAEEYNNDWIPCSERLPEESGEYLTYVDYADETFIAIDEIDCDGLIKEWNCTPNYHVIAWQPLPEPYKQIVR